MIKTFILCAFGISLFGVGLLGASIVSPPVQGFMPDAIGFTAGPIEFRTHLDGVSARSSDTSELAFTVYSRSGQILKIKF